MRFKGFSCLFTITTFNTYIFKVFANTKNTRSIQFHVAFVTVKHDTYTLTNKQQSISEGKICVNKCWGGKKRHPRPTLTRIKIGITLNDKLHLETTLMNPLM